MSTHPAVIATEDNQHYYGQQGLGTPNTESQTNQLVDDEIKTIGPNGPLAHHPKVSKKQGQKNKAEGKINGVQTPDLLNLGRKNHENSQKTNAKPNNT
jgi:hypothetical protein